MTYATEFTRQSRGRARVVVLAAGLVGQTLLTIALGYGEYSKGVALLVAAVGTVAWIGPMLACRATWYRTFAVVWALACGLLAWWFLPLTFVVLLATLGSIATKRPAPGARRDLGMVLATVGVAVVAFATVVVPTEPPPLHVCLVPDAPAEHGNAIFDAAMPDLDSDVDSVMRAYTPDSVVIWFDVWATEEEIQRVTEAVSDLRSVTGTSREGCPAG
jgi:hypothetical protein